MKDDVFSQEGRICVSDLEMGETYWLGYQHDRMGIVGPPESVYAVYFGFKDGKHVFFEKWRGRVLKHACPIGKEIEYHCPGIGDPGAQYIPARGEKEIPDGLEKEYILKRLSAKKN